MNCTNLQKSILKLISLTLILVLAFTVSLSGCSPKAADGENGGNAEGGNNVVNEEQTPKTLEGTIDDITNGTITVKDKDGAIYYFERDDSIVVSDDGALEIGRTIHVTYVGELKKSDGIQEIKLISYYVEKSEASLDNTAAEPGNSANSGEDKKPPVADGDKKPAADGSDKNENRVTNGKNADEILKTMSLEEKVAQMFIVRCPEKNAADTVSKYQFGGYILFARDFKGYDKSSVIANINSYQKNAKIPMFIGVDEEGGTVNRVSLYKQFRAAPFWSPRDLYNEGGWPLIKSDTLEKVNLLKSLGINLNFTPVADVSINPADYMYKRSFGVSDEKTAEFVGTVADVMKKNKMGSVLKHFPGYGSNKDTHTGIAIDERSLENFRENDFLPFKAGIRAGAPVVLVSHNIVKSMDAEHPASLSAAVHNILRDELGFSGLIITDDLYMDAIRKYTHGQEAAVMAVMAGNDLLCCTDYETQYPAVVEAVKNGRIPEGRIDESVLRILNYKLEAGIIK